MYKEGSGVEQNIQKGFEWIKKSAEQGVPYSQKVVGSMYFTGHGTKKTLKMLRSGLLRLLKMGMLKLN